MSRRFGIPIGRAVAELAVIAIGVVVGLGVDRWAAGVDERDLEQVYLEALRADFIANRETAGLRAEAERQLADLGASLLSFLRGDPGDISPVQLVIAAELSGYTVQRPYAQGAWDDLTATGRTVLIRDPELRIAVSDFYGVTGRTRARLEEEFFDYAVSYRYPARAAMDPELRLSINDAFNGWDGDFLARTVEAMKGVDLRSTVVAIADAPELAIPLGDVVMSHRISVLLAEEDLQAINAILQMIDRAVGAL